MEVSSATTKYITEHDPWGYRLASGFSAVSIAHSAYIGGTGFEGSNAVVLNQGQITATLCRCDRSAPRRRQHADELWIDLRWRRGTRATVRERQHRRIRRSGSRPQFRNDRRRPGERRRQRRDRPLGTFPFSSIDNQGLVLVGGEGGDADRAQYNSRGVFPHRHFCRTDGFGHECRHHPWRNRRPWRTRTLPITRRTWRRRGCRPAVGGRRADHQHWRHSGGEGGPSDGPVVGAGGVGVDFIQGGRLYNNGLIEGGDSGPGPGSASGGYGVFQRDGGTIVNAGTILSGSVTARRRRGYPSRASCETAASSPATTAVHRRGGSSD